MKYRAELDGLRAIAVVSVILYHAGFTVAGANPFQGGYVGVDVFFVISGYLITLILLREMQSDSFTFMRFYERRARRILPALFVVMLVSIPFAWAYLLPQAFKSYAGSLASTVLFGSNFFFWQEDEYAADAIALKPFIHTWSLSVEEQFYLLFPMAMLLCWRFAQKHIMALFAVGFVMSLLLAEWSSTRHVSANFYLAPTRAWELLAGAMLAKLEMDRGRPDRGMASATLPAVGVALIVAAILLMDDATRHPSLITLAPVLGTMLLIRYSGRGDPVSIVLASRAFVGVGLISYSLYLWHQPIFAFARISAVDEPVLIDKFAWIALSLVCATASYWWVEKPFRNRQLITRRLVWATASVGPAAILVAGLHGFVSNGMPSRFEAFPDFYFEMLEAEAVQAEARESECFDYAGGRDYCKFVQGTGAVTLATVGDSHLRSLDEPLLSSIEGTDAAYIPLNRSACPLVTGLERVSARPGERYPCTSAYNQRRIDVLRENSPAIAILGGRLPLILESSGFDNREGGVEYTDETYWFIDAGEVSRTPAPLPVIEERFRATVAALLREGIRVVIIYPIPEVGWHVPQRLAQRLPRSAPDDLRAWAQEHQISTSYALFRQRSASTYALYDSIPDHPQLLRIYPEELFCNTRLPGRCIAHDDSHIFYRDGDHLSLYGATLLVERMFQRMDEQWGLETTGLQPVPPKQFARSAGATGVAAGADP
ncbi:MAG: acyltransferase family protein [Pseudomonadales bacterium]